MLKLSYTFPDDSPEPVFSIEGMNREIVCTLLNALYASAQLYGDAAAKDGKPKAGRHTWDEFNTYMLKLQTAQLAVREALNNADAEAANNRDAYLAYV